MDIIPMSIAGIILPVDAPRNDVADKGQDAVPQVSDRVEPANPVGEVFFHLPGKYEFKKDEIVATRVHFDSSAVDHPSHYVRDRKYEPIDVIEDWDLPYNTASAVKYLSRAGRKGDEITDIKKAIFHLNRRIQQLEKA